MRVIHTIPVMTEAAQAAARPLGLVPLRHSREGGNPLPLPLDSRPLSSTGRAPPDTRRTEELVRVIHTIPVMTEAAQAATRPLGLVPLRHSREGGNPLPLPLDSRPLV